MKKVICAVVLLCFMLSMSVSGPVLKPIELEPGKTIEKIDADTAKVTTTYEQVVEKRHLLEEKQNHQHDIDRANEEITRIDEMLEVWNRKE